MDLKGILNLEFPECANKALMFIRNNYNRCGRQELTNLAYKCVFFNDYNQEQSTWIKKTNRMQELQCVDCIINFFESESDPTIRDFIFDLLFGDFYHQQSSKFILQLLFSYAISLEAQKSLESAAKWTITNIGNEITQNIFEQIVKDHFLLYQDPNSNEIQRSLTNLCNLSPLFASLFMSIILDMLANEMIKNPEKFLSKMFSLIEIWMEKNPQIGLLAYKTNISHFSSYMLNPFPGLLFSAVVHPLKYILKKCEDKTYNKICDDLVDINLMANKISLISLKLIKDMSVNSIGTQSQDLFKLLNLKNFEYIEERLANFLLVIQELDRMEFKDLLRNLLFDCLERLAQILELCLQYGFTNCTKNEMHKLFSNLVGNFHHHNYNDSSSISLMEIVLSS